MGKIGKLTYLAAPVVICALSASIAVAESDFTIDWFSVVGGGGTSEGDSFSVSGTIGQSESLGLSGGQYAVCGGFWVLSDSPVPVLTIRVLGDSVIISWPSDSGACRLQESRDLENTLWTQVEAQPKDDGTNRQVTITLSRGVRFYRLLLD